MLKICLKAKFHFFTKTYLSNHIFNLKFDESILTYKKAVNFAQKHLGNDNDLVKNLKNVLN